MEIKQAMNTCTISAIQSSRNEGKLAITDATAVYAWCDSRDEAAALWLCEKYRPLIAHIVARETRNPVGSTALVDEALYSALADMDTDISVNRVGTYFARITIQVCRGQFSVDEENEVMLAA